jgi:AcrR family transcriptional regulator
MATTRPRRLTRAESQQRTRGLIIEAATELFLRDGFSSTSLEAVAEEAGFTVGAVYSNFKNKTAMGVAVIDELYAREERRLEATLIGATPDDWFDALSAWADETIGDPDWMRLEIEIAASSAHDPTHRAATAARYRRLRDRCRQLLEVLLGAAPAADLDMLATAAVGLALGIGAQRAVDPSVAGSTLSEMLRVLVDAQAA